MSVLTSDVPVSRVDSVQFEALYEEQFEFLLGVSVRKFRVPVTEAETLVHEVFLTYLKRSNEIYDLSAWFLGAICHASRHYWRINARSVNPDETFDRVDPASARIVDTLPDQIAAREALECLTPRCQEVLRMRYFDGFSIAEIAERLGLKAKYTQKLVTKCLRRAERAYTAKGKKKRKQ